MLRIPLIGCLYLMLLINLEGVFFLIVVGYLGYKVSFKGSSCIKVEARAHPAGKNSRGCEFKFRVAIAVFSFLFPYPGSEMSLRRC